MGQRALLDLQNEKDNLERAAYDVQNKHMKNLIDLDRDMAREEKLKMRFEEEKVQLLIIVTKKDAEKKRLEDALKKKNDEFLKNKEL
jgi:hypothetical protein